MLKDVTLVASISWASMSAHAPQNKAGAGDCVYCRAVSGKGRGVLRAGCGVPARGDRDFEDSSEGDRQEPQAAADYLCAHSASEPVLRVGRASGAVLDFQK